MNRALARTQLVVDGGPPRCPDCQKALSFECDRQGLTLGYCSCGYCRYVLRRDGKLATPGVPELIPSLR